MVCGMVAGFGNQQRTALAIVMAVEMEMAKAAVVICTKATTETIRSVAKESIFGQTGMYIEAIFKMI